MENDNTPVIERYDYYIIKFENIIAEIEKDEKLDRQQRNRLIDRIDNYVILHCKGKIDVLNGTYVPPQNNSYKRGQ